MNSKDIRWKQRFNNFTKAYKQLSEFLIEKQLNKLEQQGLIQCFEYNYELAWNTIKDFYEAQGEVNIQGSKDAFRLAFKRGLIKNGEVWMDMIQSRALTSHTYNEDTAQAIIVKITTSYHQEFKNLYDTLKKVK